MAEEQRAEPAREADGPSAPDADGSPTPDTVPRVDLSLYQVSVSVSGRAEDDLDDVEETARRLMDYLVDRAETLEEEPDERGLG